MIMVKTFFEQISSFVELDDSDSAEIKKAYRAYREARRVLSPAPRYRNMWVVTFRSSLFSLSNVLSVESSPSPDASRKTTAESFKEVLKHR